MLISKVKLRNLVYFGICYYFLNIDPIDTLNKNAWNLQKGINITQAELFC